MKKNLLLFAVSLLMAMGVNAQVLSEDFSTLTVAASGSPTLPVVLTGWTNFAEAGTRTWAAKEYTANKYAQFGAFGSTEASNIGWLVTPAINFDGFTGETLTFDSKSGYYMHDGLSVYVSTNFDGTNVTAATWTLLTATLATNPIQGTNYSDWVPSGSIDLSTFTGTGYIAFKYTGGDPSGTTTFQIDNVIITGTAASVNDIAASVFTMYPNPVSNVLNIKGNIANVTITNAIGQEVIRTNETSIQTSSLQAGLYFVTVTDIEGNIATRKLIKN